MSKAREIISKALNIDIERIESGFSVHSSAAWDSLGHARLVIAIEDEIGRPLDPIEIISIEDFGSIESLLAK